MQSNQNKLIINVRGDIFCNNKGSKYLNMPLVKCSKVGMENISLFLIR